MGLHKNLDRHTDTPIGQRTLAGLAGSFISLLLAVTVIAYVAKQIWQNGIGVIDAQILYALHSYSNPLLDGVALGVTYAGNVPVVMILGIIATLLVRNYGEETIRGAVQIAVTIIGALLLNNLLKLIFQRERPELWQLITFESTYSFPSGHALLTASLAMLVVLLWHHASYKRTIIAGALLYTLLVGISRLYLGVHYASDVLAGWLIGSAWAIVVAVVLGVVRFRTKATS